MISLKQLRYAISVQQTRHFKHAADQCFISQSALSSAIAELESQLGVHLFERDNKKVLVTPIGEEILARAQDVLNQVRDIEQFAKSNKAPLSQPMSMGVIPTIGPYLLPKVLPALRQDFPDFELTISEEQSGILVEKVKSGALDTAIVALPFNVEGLLTFEFWQEDFYAILHQDDPYSCAKEINQEQLKKSHLLLLKEGHCLSDHALAICKMTRAPEDKSLAGTSLFTLVQMVAGKMGSTLVPEMALSSVRHQNPELKALRVNEPGPHRRIAFIMRPNYAGIGSIELLKDLFSRELKKAQA